MTAPRVPAAVRSALSQEPGTPPRWSRRAVNTDSNRYPGHEQRMAAHAARIEALGLAGEEWRTAARRMADIAMVVNRLNAKRGEAA